MSKRIAIFGRPGSGKSTFALKLSQKLNLPLIHLDRWFFNSNWVKRDTEDFQKILQQFVDQENWIMDGNATRSLEARYAKAEIVLYFYYPFYLCLWRVFKRIFTKDYAIQDRAENCNERVSFELIKYLWEFDKRVQEKLCNLHIQYPHVEIYKITNDRDLEKLCLEKKW